MGISKTPGIRAEELKASTPLHPTFTPAEITEMIEEMEGDLSMAVPLEVYRQASTIGELAIAIQYCYRPDPDVIADSSGF